MAFKLRKRVKIAPGVSVNLSKSGISTTIGGKTTYSLAFFGWSIASILKAIIKFTGGMLTLIKFIFLLGFWAAVLYLLVKLFWL
ncbi:DUF4236 domain-containing protein [Mannheimia massilioguelmaensis]|uniref:DUF4236 domain-containing protein n=1 Tax=Mannheimia massilioguelmaensis TaxID=1604354 RepID=UPI0005C89B75|nr:DUF4236 domain-containing protein [Mannheimia massilioguelmaensis]